MLWVGLEPDKVLPPAAKPCRTKVRPPVGRALARQQPAMWVGLGNEANRRARCWGSYYETKPTAAPAAGGPTTKRSQPPCLLLGALGALARKNLSKVAQFFVRAKRPA
jgi:hypothetical protein